MGGTFVDNFNLNERSAYRIFDLKSKIYKDSSLKEVLTLAQVIQNKPNSPQFFNEQVSQLQLVIGISSMNETEL